MPQSDVDLIRATYESFGPRRRPERRAGRGPRDRKAQRHTAGVCESAGAAVCQVFAPLR